MQCLNIRSTYAQIGMRTQQGYFDIKQPQAEVRLGNSPAKLDLKTTPGRVEINRDKFWASLGNDSILRLSAKWAQEARQLGQEGISRMAREGDQIAEAGGRDSGVFASIARANVQPEEKEVVLKRPDPPQITFIPAKVENHTQVEPLDATIRPQPVELNYHRAKVDVYLDRRQSIRMWTTEGQCDIYA